MKMKAMMLNHKNSNGRIYSSEMMEKEIEDFNNRIHEHGCVLGELYHNTDDAEVIELKNVSHKMTSVFIDNELVRVDVEILDTPCGEIAKTIREDNFCLTPIGSGEIDEETGLFKNYKLTTFNLIPKESWAWNNLINDKDEQ